MTSRFARVFAVAGLVVLGSVAASAAAQRIRVGGDIKAPERVVRVDPVYPEQAKADRITGTVFIEAVIGTDGKVVNDKIVRSAHPLLDDAAAEAVRQWEYIPTLLNGEPVEVVMTVNVTFSLRDQKPAGEAPPAPAR
jgi:TonB family protein